MLEVARIYWKWLKECELTCSPHTIRSYETTVCDYFDYIQNNASITQLSCESCFAKDVIVKWIQYLTTTKQLAPETCNVRLANIRSFLKYMAENEMRHAHLYLEAKNIKPLRCIKKKQHAISEVNLNAYLQVPDSKTRSGCIDIMIMSFLYGTAVRVGEMRMVQMKDLHLDDRQAYVHILGKGNKERIVYIPVHVVKNLLRYIKIFHGRNPLPESFLFYSRVKGKSSPMTAAAIDKRLKNVAKAAHDKDISVPCDLHAHAFRRTRATNLSNNGLNPFQISKILGHENLSTTLKYVDVSMDKKERDLASMEDEGNRETDKI